MSESIPVTDISDDKLLELWRDPNFSGSYRGVKTFQILLKTDLNINVSESRLYKILRNDQIFLMHQRKTKKIQRRSYDVNFYGQLVHIDLAHMYPDPTSGSKYFLLLIDVFSFKIFVHPLKEKSSETVAKALKTIFSDFGADIYEIQSDRGTEFKGKPCKDLFKEKKILFRFKFGKNKANFAEEGILLVKRKLYMTLRGTLSQQWVSILQKVVLQLNSTPLKRLGWLKPDSIGTIADSVKVNEAKQKNNIQIYREPTYKEQLANKKSYKGDISEGDYVYLDFDEKLFDKSFDVSVQYDLNSSQEDAIQRN